MKILVTAGNTETPIDRVRCLTNIFSGRTGARIAREGYDRGHEIVWATSRPEALADPPPRGERWTIAPYRTFDDLATLLERQVRDGRLDAIIHGAAVSDYALAGVFAPDRQGNLRDVAAGKVKSHHPELWLKLVPTPKLIDRFRADWNFRGKLVKFKLEVGIGEAELEAIAESSRQQSGADVIVANTLEGMTDWAILGPIAGQYQRISRDELPARVLDAIS